MNGIPKSLFAGAIVCGLLVQVPTAQASREKLVYDFCNQENCTDGSGPTSGLTDVNGTLYGTTFDYGVGLCYGGPACGVVYALDPQTGAETVLHSFTNPDTDGMYPHGGVIDVKGTLYGTTGAGGGGNNPGGTVFALDPQTGAEWLLHTFSGGSDGYIPGAGLIGVKSWLYGTTTSGGGGGGNNCYDHGCGIVFAINRKTGAETVLHAFNAGADGAVPWAGLIEVNGTLYGTTTQGGGGEACFNGCGTVFAIDPKSGTETVVHAFAGGNDGSDPTAGLINVKGRLYGTTMAGGAHGGGTVFALDLQTGLETVLYSFCGQQNCTDGKSPEASLTYVKGTLYGTVFEGGANNGGAVFALDPKNGAETVLYAFGTQENFADGMGPLMGLLAKGKWLYSTTYYGGPGSNSGVVFAVKR